MASKNTSYIYYNGQWEPVAKTAIYQNGGGGGSSEVLDKIIIRDVRLTADDKMTKGEDEIAYKVLTLTIITYPINEELVEKVKTNELVRLRLNRKWRNHKHTTFGGLFNDYESTTLLPGCWDYIMPVVTEDNLKQDDNGNYYIVYRYCISDFYKEAVNQLSQAQAEESYLEYYYDEEWVCDYHLISHPNSKCIGGTKVVVPNKLSGNRSEAALKHIHSPYLKNTTVFTLDWKSSTIDSGDWNDIGILTRLQQNKHSLINFFLDRSTVIPDTWDGGYLYNLWITDWNWFGNPRQVDNALSSWPHYDDGDFEMYYGIHSKKGLRDFIAFSFGILKENYQTEEYEYMWEHIYPINNKIFEAKRKESYVPIEDNGYTYIDTHLTFDCWIRNLPIY